jgi:hypothetical protein
LHGRYLERFFLLSCVSGLFENYGDFCFALLPFELL